MTTKEITEKTVLPISMIIILLAGASWVMSVYAEGKQNAQAIVEIKLRQDEYTRTVQSIDSRLSRIEGAVARGR